MLLCKSIFVYKDPENGRKSGVFVVTSTGGRAFNKLLFKIDLLVIGSLERLVIGNCTDYYFLPVDYEARAQTTSRFQKIINKAHL
jgi:hypothetical protein